MLNFAFLYWNDGTVANFGHPLSHLDAIWFAIGTLTTVGTGGLAPRTESVRLIQTIQMVVDFVVVSAAGAVVTRITPTAKSR